MNPSPDARKPLAAPRYLKLTPGGDESEIIPFLSSGGYCMICVQHANYQNFGVSG